ncbi:hypothetical protein TURU_119562 [Turdus rufiventris]|nr:hypothetical protein TURU_119562 [Turdus rufiventris]
MPVVLWDQVTLTCQGSETASATTWYKDGQRWGQDGTESFAVTENGTCNCYRSGTGLNPPMTVSDDWLVLQVPAQALVEGDTLTLLCRGWRDNSVTSVSLYRDGKNLEKLQAGTELYLFPLELNHSGHYSCSGGVFSFELFHSESVSVTVQGPPPEPPPPPEEGEVLYTHIVSTKQPGDCLPHPRWNYDVGNCLVLKEKRLLSKKEPS